MPASARPGSPIRRTRGHRPEMTRTGDDRPAAPSQDPAGRHGQTIPMEVHVFARSLALAALTGLCLAATAGASTDLVSSVRFGFVPQKAFQGQPASLSVV